MPSAPPRWIDEVSESTLADGVMAYCPFARCPRRRFRPGPVSIRSH
jgi:hypothetical protein